MKFKKMRDYTHEEFIKKYEELAPAYPESLVNGHNTLKHKLSSKKVDQLIKLNKKLKLNDDFAHEVIDMLFESKNPVTLCEISCAAIYINYRKDEAIKIIKKNLKKINNPPYVYMKEFFLRETCNISISDK